MPPRKKNSRTDLKQYHFILGNQARLVNRNDSAARENHTNNSFAGGRRSTDKKSFELYAAWMRLSAREQDVAILVCQGLSDAQIAVHLSLAIGTVKSYLQKIFIKLDIYNRRELMLKFTGFDFPRNTP